MADLDVMGLHGPNPSPQYIQNDTGPRSLDPRVGVGNATTSNNPLNLLGPNKTPNHFESDYRIPSVNSAVGNAPVPNGNVLGVVWPIPKFHQPGT